MNIRSKVKENFLIARVQGELDVDSVPHFRQKIETRLDKRGVDHLVLDLGEVNFIDSTGVGVLLGRYRNIKSREGKMILVNLNSHIERVLRLAGLINLVDVYDSEKDFFRQKKGGDYLVQ